METPDDLLAVDSLTAAVAEATGKPSWYRSDASVGVENPIGVGRVYPMARVAEGTAAEYKKRAAAASDCYGLVWIRRVEKTVGRSQRVVYVPMFPKAETLTEAVKLALAAVNEKTKGQG